MKTFIKVSALVFVFSFLGLGLSHSVLAEDNQQFIATDNPAHLNVINTVVGGTATSADFNVTVTGADANPGSFPGSESGTDVELTALTDYEVTVDAKANYVTTYSDNCSGTSINEFHPLTCTITNTFQEDVVTPAATVAPTSTIVATKIICPSETDLPNMSGGADITSTTATDFIASHPQCHLAPNWQFQVRYWRPSDNTDLIFDAAHDPNNQANTPDPGKAFVGEAGAPWTTISGVTDSNGTISTTFNSNDVWHFFVREVLQDGYIPFGGDSTGLPGSDVSAEMYCGSDVMNYDNKEQVNGPFTGGETFYCVAFNVPKPVIHTDTPKSTIVATKIVCDSEADLPNMSGGADITATTATDYVAAHPNCHLAPNWQFQVRYWGEPERVGGGTPNATDPGKAFVGEAGAPWTTISGVTDANGVISTTFNSNDVYHFFVREVLQDGYIPFGGDSNDLPGSDVSAEMYCGSDVMNYDNKEQVNGPFTGGETFHCVAFNVPVKTIDVCPNIEGTQAEVPSGQHLDGENCVPDETHHHHSSGGPSGGRAAPVGEVLGAEAPAPVVSPGLPRTDGGNIPLFMITLSLSGFITLLGLIVIARKPSFKKVN